MSGSQGTGGRGMTTNRYRVYFRGDENVLEWGSGDDCTALNILKTTECALYKGEFYVTIRLFICI